MNAQDKERFEELDSYPVDELPFEEIKWLITKLREVVAENERLKEANQWRKIDDKTPRDKAILLRDGNIVRSGEWVDMIGWEKGFYFDDSLNPSLVTHWMPLPQPPTTK